MVANTNIGRNIRFIRTKRNFTMRNLADAMSDYGYFVTAMQIGCWERGERIVPADALYYMALALRCSVSFFFVNSETELNESTMMLSPRATQILQYVFTKWTGDANTLMEFINLYVSLSEDERQYIAGEGILQYEHRSNDDFASETPVDIETIINGWKKLTQR